MSTESQASKPAAIEVVEVHKNFGAVRALDGVSLAVRAGEFLTMLGPSGSGKTTLLRAIAGFERVDGGVIRLLGQDVTHLPPHQRAVNTVFQDYALFPHMSVAQNVEYGLLVKGVARAERTRRVAEALDKVGLPVGAYGGRKPIQLSGGQRQRVALARALINRPPVLLLDEPLGALDHKLRQAMQLELKRIHRDAGITFLFVTHDQEEALTMSDRIAIFDAGRIQQLGTPQEIYEAPASEYVANFIGVSNILEHEGARYSVRPERVRLLTGDEGAPAGMVARSAVVGDVIYIGTASRIRLVRADGKDVFAVVPNSDPGTHASVAPAGTTVRYGWRPDQAWRLRA